MTSSRLSNLYLPSKLAYHVKIVLGSILVTMFFNMIWQGEPFAGNFWEMAVLVFLQLEIFMLVAGRIFRLEHLKSSKKYKRKIVVRLVIFYLIVLVIAALFMFLMIIGEVVLRNANFYGTFNQFVSYAVKPSFISWLIGVGIGSLFFFYSEWSHSLKREYRLREEKLIFQYERLKNQVNPHFLFNSLNTLSSLVAKDAQLSEKFINKFSSIYRYILEHADKDWVDLSEELEFVSNYFFLQKIRDEGKIQLHVEVKEPSLYKVLPISLQLLIENALKHNAATKESPLRISIRLKGDDLVVENNRQKKMLLEPSSNIGLKNLKERILLVMNKELVVEENDDSFVVKLPMMKTSIPPSRGTGR